MTNKILSQRMAWLSGLPLVDRMVHAVKVAAAPSEKRYKYNGFLSYHAETHAVGAGLGIGFMALSSGNLKVLGLVLEAVLLGNRGESLLEMKLLSDIRQEQHYFLGGIVFGAMLSILANMATKGEINTGF